jgi:hypothetical protein
VLVTNAEADAPTVFVNIRYLNPAATELAVVIVLEVDAVPVKLAVTVEHENVPPVFVRASVLALYVKALACVSKDDASDPLATFVKRRRNATALAVFVIVMFEPDPAGPCGPVAPSAPSRKANPMLRFG